MKKLLISIFALNFLISLPALADKETKAKELLKLQQFDEQINSVLKQQLFVPIECSFVIPETAKDAVMKEVKEAMDIRALTDPIIQFAVDRYTEEDLDELIRFYKTPTGQKSIKIQAEQALFMPQQLQKWIVETLPKVQKVGEKLEQQYPQRSGNEAQACVQKYQQ